MLGILAQESNFWQASKFSVPGVPGNPLIGNYYGIDRSSSSLDAWWQIDYSEADCGYGIAQVTDLMRVGDMSYSLQEAIATDFKANIARGIQILTEKWNQTRDAGLIINNGDPKYIENWFFALWAYNTGFYPETTASEPWGVGWLNNPINAIYPPNRTPFLDGSPSDAAHPQDWPYPEKVLGFAAHSVQFLDSVSHNALGDSFSYVSAFTPSWWAGSDGVGGIQNRKNVKPPIALFCDASNYCNPSVNGPAGACTHTAMGGTYYDYKCWYHKPAVWKADCASLCGYEDLTYSQTSSKPAAANSFPANCSTSGLPQGALIIDNLPNGAPAAAANCTPVPTSGSFQFNFAGNAANQWPSKIDTHQLGSGFNGQFYFSHTRVPNTSAAAGGALDVSGTWTLGQNLSGWAGVYVHMPSHGAWLQQANYVINTGLNSVTRSVNQRNYANTWVSLGVLQFAGTPSITLSNSNVTYTNPNLAEALSGSDDIAWDAVAFVPLASKPTDFVVALGDSYSSGEGTSAPDGSEFFRGSDHHGKATPHEDGETIPDRNACHRSYDAWPYQIDIPGVPGADSARALVQAKDPRVDFQLLACAGAEWPNIVHSNTTGALQQYGERTQLDRGFLDSNTTLVTMTIGGNDIGFGPIINGCVQLSLAAIAPAVADCEHAAAPSNEYEGTYGQMVDSRLAALPAQVTQTLQQIRNSADNARIVLLGYPTLFETGSACIQIQENNRVWLNSVASRLNSALTKAAYDAGSFVTYQSPQYLFKGNNLCTSTSAITGLIFQLTPGDAPMFTYNGWGPNFGAGVSAQSVHPNDMGAELYAAAANETVRSTRVPLSSSLVGGAATTYYSTFRLHDGGAASMSVSSFSSCGQEIRFGLRRNDSTSSGVIGQQHTDSLSWTKPHAMQTFTWTGGSSNTVNLPSGWYALNGRLVGACSGGAAQPWSADLYW
jgi:hypothetical protein